MGSPGVLFLWLVGADGRCEDGWRSRVVDVVAVWGGWRGITFRVVWGLSGLTGGGGPSALRWMAAIAEFAFACRKGVASSLRWIRLSI